MDRRKYLSAAIVALTVPAFAGCSSSSSSDDDNGNNGDSSDPSGGNDGNNGDSSDSSGGDDGEATSICSMLPGSFIRFEPSSGPFPFSFEHPEILSEQIGYPGEGQTRVAGSTVRGDIESEGDLALEINIDRNSRGGTDQERDTWYDQNSQYDSIVTTSIGGSDVEFLYRSPEGNYTDVQGTYVITGLVPYEWDSVYDSPNQHTTSYHVVSARVTLSGVEDLTSSCAEDLRTTLEQIVQSLSYIDDTSAFEEQVG